MKKLLIPVAALLLSDALLLIGHGLQLTLLPIHAEIIGFSAAQIGLIGSTYFVGFVSGCLLTPYMVRRVGHIRGFAVLATSYSAIILLFHYLPWVGVWALLRLGVGFTISGLYMIIESWLNERSSPQSRGTVLSIYTMINLTMTVVGQQIVNLADPAEPVLFAVIAILLSLALIPVSLSSALAPAPIHNVRIDVRQVWKISPVGVGGAVTCGLVTGAFWTLGPLYGRSVGFEIPELTMFLSAVVLGGAVFQLPLGRLSDRYDRRLVLFYSCLMGATLSVLLFAVPLFVQTSIIWLAFLWGGCVMTLYAICLAHANDRAPPEDFVMVGSVMLLAMGSFSALGAFVAAGFMSVFGPGGMFIFSALCLAGFAMALAVRRRINVLPVHDETGPFRAVAETTTPMALELDPRTSGDEQN